MGNTCIISPGGEVRYHNPSVPLIFFLLKCLTKPGNRAAMYMFVCWGVHVACSANVALDYEEEFEDTKGAIRNRISKKNR